MARPSLREKILKAGLHAMHAGGYAATGVQTVTSMAGVPKGSFYNHFPSKEALAIAALDVYFRDHRRLLEQLEGGSSEPPLVRLRGYFEAVTKLLERGGYTRGCMLGNFATETADHSPALRVSVARLLGDLSAAIARCLEEARNSGEIDHNTDVDALAEFVVNSWEGAIMRMKADKGARPLKLFQEILFTKLLPAHAGNVQPTHRNATSRGEK